MDCDDLTLLLAAAEDRTLTASEDEQLDLHAASCDDCRQLLADGRAANLRSNLRSIVSVPEDALDDRDLLVLPVVDPGVFISEGELARGGMGRIVRVHDRRLGRDVAIKEVLATHLRARFEREVMITAQLQHPAIIPVYEAGTWPDGSAFYTMRLVAGGTLADAIGKATTLEARLALMPHVVALTDALAYAHSKRVVHRDLKPSNVLVGEFGETVVIDWGLAKQLDRDGGDNGPATRPQSPELTMSGSLMGTPGFMAPEQVAGEDVAERADVYALGAILYNLLAGHPPYLDDLAIKNAIALLAAASERPPTPIDRREPRAPRDLCAIVERAMARDQTARYPSAKDMADELRRFSAGQLLRSREYTVRELARRWVRRHRAAVSVAAIALAVLAVVAITSVREIVRRRDQAELAVAHGRLEQGRQLLVAGDPSHAAPHLAAAALALPDDPIARRLARLALRDADRRLATLRGTAIAFSPDGATLVVGRDDGAVQLVDASSGRALRLLPAHGGKITRVAYAGGMLVTASRTGAFMRNPMSGDAVELARDAVNDVIVVGDRVAIASDTGIQLGGLDGANLVRAPLAGAGSLDVSPDGSQLLALSKTETAVWSLPALTRIATLPARWWGRFDRDGSVVLGDSNVLERFASSGAPVVLLHGQVQPIERLSGDELATANLRIDTASNTTRVLVPEGATHSVSIDPTHLVTAGFDGALRVWDLDRSAQPIAVLAAADSTTGLVIDASHTRLAALGGHATVELWDVQRLPAPVVAAHADAELGALIAHSGRIAGWLNGHGVDRAAVLADPLHPVPGWLGELTATEMLVGTGGQIVAIDVRDANQRREFRDDASIDHVAVSASGAVLATDAAGRITLRTLRTAAIVDRFDTGFRDITAVAVDDSDHVVTGHDDGTIRIWTVGLRTATVLRGHTAHVEMLALRRDRLLSGSWDSTTRAWAFPAGEARGIVLSNAHGPVVVSPDGRWLATVERAGLVDIWDSSGGRLIERIATAGVPASTAFVDDDHLAVGSESGVLELFDISAPTRSDAELARVTN